MVWLFLIHFHILHPVDNFSCFLWSFAVLFHLLWNEDRLGSLSWIQDYKNGRFMVCAREQQCFLSYYNIFLPLKAKVSLQGMVTMSPESPYQVLMITQSPVSFEYRWVIFSKVIAFVLFIWKCTSTSWPPLGISWCFLVVHHSSFLFPIWKNSMLSANLAISLDTLDIPSFASLAKVINKSNQETNVLVILLFTFHHRMLVYFDAFIPESMLVL